MIGFGVSDRYLSYEQPHTQVPVPVTNFIELDTVEDFENARRLIPQALW